MPIFIPIIFFDFTQNNCFSIYRALRKHMLASPLVFVNLFIIQISFAYFLSKHEGFGILGIFLGNLIGFLVLSTSFFALMFFFDFEEIQTSIKESVKKADESLQKRLRN